MKKVNKKELTKALSQSEIVTLAVYLLGGANDAVDTEDAAFKANELAPGRFTWRKYPEQINLELIRVYLSDAKKAAKGTLLIGTGRTGWKLTQKGLKWAHEAEKSLSQLDLGRQRKDSRSGSVDENRWRRERARIVSTEAWIRWNQSDQDLSAREAEEVFRIDSYSVGTLRETKITRALSLFADDDEIAPFLADMAKIVDENWRE